MRKHNSGRIERSELEKAGARELPDGDGIEIHGWRVQTRKAPIVSDARAEDLKHSLGDVLNIPEQFFADSFLRLTHLPTRTVLEFSAQDAIKSWQELNLPPVQVGHAKDWTRARKQDIQAHAAIELKYDWTFTTAYTGTLTSERTEGAAPAGGGAQWETCIDAIDKSLLLARDPILFYDEVPLYESELDDNGVSQCIVKVRVMARCWFVLLRFWLRVDGVLVRLREARLCGRFARGPHMRQAESSQAPSRGGADSAQGESELDVTRETRHSEGTFAELRAAGAPPEGAAYADADVASEALQAVAPTGVTFFQIEKLVPES